MTAMVRGRNIVSMGLTIDPMASRRASIIYIAGLFFGGLLRLAGVNFTPSPAAHETRRQPASQSGGATPAIGNQYARDLGHKRSR
jgi:hypothetical protein